MKVLTVAVAICALLLVGSPTWAHEGVKCEHAKLNTEDASPVAPGEWEIEFSYGLSQARRVFDDDWISGFRPLLREEEYGVGVTYGLVENVDVGFGVGYADIYDRDTAQLVGRGFGDVELGAKWRFYHDEAAGLEIAYTPAVVLPTGRREKGDRIGITDDFVSIFNGIAASKDWGGRWTSNFDLGYSWPVGEDRHDYRGTLSGNAAIGCQVNDWLQPEIELNYEHGWNHGDDADRMAATAGLIVCLSETMRLDVGVQRTLLARDTDHSTSFAAALTFAF